ncbi:hypothetical protein MPTK1_4g14570 [Marchantia polymorpha subsp. ruderalis]|uniref:Uncharacterized protein n=2 Tax=Marchantia polymorpha TaxID=3197 RepID=A0AAF6B9W6_MARPO|nr:hypothetical protein MARPO_0070s0024 [Marchantia polymorpha]PTQ35553.1 hypothetical protein MARPO_0070s0024 [Marchantia polymorpha]BBN08799.1 hypothetical protein Mp_4g14570 [Marchantia polymorpha subsp. ruderalis]BBN08800.1 hypothetical protein Mp_4g14570 [Marchantia polymorpha subsp. ruderalis]|eukprot:PTQ35552.1 hypothetical protein MARPO_0070s0024 [Marchantia polymorpha]
MGNTCSNSPGAKAQSDASRSKTGSESADDPKRKRSMLQQLGDTLSGRPPWNPSTLIPEPPRKTRELDEYPIYAPSSRPEGADKSKPKSSKKGKPSAKEDDSKSYVLYLVYDDVMYFLGLLSNSIIPRLYI